MPQPYSLDLRERVVRFVSSGRSRRAAAAHFEVSVSFVVKLMKAYQARGDLAPKPSGGRRHSKLEPHREFLLARVTEKSDITMPELAAELEAAHATKGRSRFDLAMADPPLLSLQKKTLQASEQDRRDVRQARDEWMANGSRRCALSRTAWSSWMRPAPPPRWRACAAAAPRGSVFVLKLRSGIGRHRPSLPVCDAMGSPLPLWSTPR